jgi:hypothetical protein
MGGASTRALLARLPAGTRRQWASCSSLLHAWGRVRACRTEQPVPTIHNPKGERSPVSPGAPIAHSFHDPKVRFPSFHHGR